RPSHQLQDASTLCSATTNVSSGAIFGR
ncbi:hypothetical protein Hypma_013579, partial [Hypsizygus marmoreus]